MLLPELLFPELLLPVPVDESADVLEGAAELLLLLSSSLLLSCAATKTSSARISVSSSVNFIVEDGRQLERISRGREECKFATRFLRLSYSSKAESIDFELPEASDSRVPHISAAGEEDGILVDGSADAAFSSH